MPYFYFDYYYLILVVPALMLAIWAQVQVKTTYRKYSRVPNSRGMTGAYAAQAVLNFYGITDVRIEQVSGNLTDHYDPKSKVIRLSDGVYNSSTVAAIGIACHEAGHAAQHAENYAPIKIRNAIIPVCNIGSTIGIPLALIGWIFSFSILIYVGLGLYAAVFIFQVATLPVEFNASRRAIKVIDETQLLRDEEIGGAKKVLAAAAMTYVASMMVSLANLLRLLLRFSNRRD